MIITVSNITDEQASNIKASIKPHKMAFSKVGSCSWQVETLTLNCCIIDDAFGLTFIAVYTSLFGFGNLEVDYAR